MGLGRLHELQAVVCISEHSGRGGRRGPRGEYCPIFLLGRCVFFFSFRHKAKFYWGGANFSFCDEVLLSFQVWV